MHVNIDPKDKNEEIKKKRNICSCVLDDKEVPLKIPFLYLQNQPLFI